MTATPYFKCYSSDFLGGIMGLSFEEIGAFVTLVLLQYDRKRPVAADLDMLAWRGRVRPSKAKKLVERLIETGKLVLTDGAWSNPRAERELSSFRLSAEISARNGRDGAEKQRGRSRKIKDLATLEERCDNAESRSQKPEAVNTACAAAARDGQSDQGDIAKRIEGAALAASPALSAAYARSPALCDLSPLNRMLVQGFDPEADILPTIVGWLARPNRQMPRSWEFFAPIVADARQKRLAASPAAAAPKSGRPSPFDANGRPRAPGSDANGILDRGYCGVGRYIQPDDRQFWTEWHPLVASFRVRGAWAREDLGPAPGEPGCLVPPDVIENVDAGYYTPNLPPSRWGELQNVKVVPWWMKSSGGEMRH